MAKMLTGDNTRIPPPSACPSSAVARQVQVQLSDNPTVVAVDYDQDYVAFVRCALQKLHLDANEDASYELCDCGESRISMIDVLTEPVVVLRRKLGVYIALFQFFGVSVVILCCPSRSDGDLYY
eukprot:TRINITY_DN364_c0_g1_i1.p1 TRINITY_DN364_c0_g1~~TRINITY_DN364_c0_g1_i1.p1  ORF type:complete len:131 (+),score=13.60 TRINITY_DN364_c0_g1_i1:23-394(+)